MTNGIPLKNRTSTHRSSKIRVISAAIRLLLYKNLVSKHFTAIKVAHVTQSHISYAHLYKLAEPSYHNITASSGSLALRLQIERHRLQHRTTPPGNATWAFACICVWRLYSYFFPSTELILIPLLFAAHHYLESVSQSAERFCAHTVLQKWFCAVHTITYLFCIVRIGLINKFTCMPPLSLSLCCALHTPFAYILTYNIYSVITLSLSLAPCSFDHILCGYCYLWLV